MRARFQKFVTKQFSNPSGFFGRFIGTGMARRNVFDAEWTVSLLDIQPGQHVLEIGFGPGVSTQIASEKAAQGFVAGLDHSKTMVQLASQRNAAAIRAKRMELRYGDVASLPYADSSFDIAFSLHSIYFWAEPVACLTEIKRVLKPGGLLAITIQPKEHWNTERVGNSDIMTLYRAEDVVSMFADAAYRDIRVEVAPKGEDHNFLECILGVK